MPTVELLKTLALYEMSRDFRTDVAVVKAELAERQERDNVKTRWIAYIGLVVAVLALLVSVIALFMD